MTEMQVLQRSTEKVVDKMMVLKSNGQKEKYPISLIDINCWEWPQGVGLYGLYKYYRLTGDEKTLQYLFNWYDECLREGVPEKNVNTTSPMLTLTYLYEINPQPQYLAMIEQWANWMMEEKGLIRTGDGCFQRQLLNLDEYVSDPQAFHDNFRDDLQFIFDGKMIAAPMDVTANGLIYNKTAFEQAGVEVPQSEDEIWTWEEWKQAMETVVEKSDCTYGLVYDKSPQRFTTLLYQAGGRMLKEDMTASEYNSPEVQRAVSFFKELHDDGLIPTSVWLGAENPNNLFRTGQVAMHFAGSWMVSNYKDEVTDFEWGVTYMPKDKTRSSIAGGKYIAAFQNSGVEKEAAAFIEWLSQPEQNARYCQENSYLSPVKGNESLEYEYGKEYFELFAKELEATETPASQEWGYQAFTTLVQNDLRDGLVEVLVGNKTVEDYTAEMETLMNDALQELKA